MRWPIRNQILIPFLSLQIIAVMAMAAAAAWVAVRHVEQETAARLSNVLATMETSSYPLTPAILEQLSSLSGAEFTVFDRQRRLVETTLDDAESSKIAIAGMEANVVDRELLDNRSILTIGGRQYFAGLVDHSAGMDARLLLVLYPQDAWLHARRQAMFPPLVIGAACLCLTVAVSVFIARLIGGRIQSVQSHVTRIAAGDFAPVPASAVNDELRDLSEGVNRMAAALDVSMRNIRQTERSTLLTQLVGGLAHQLRNALTGARMSVQLHRRHCSSSHDDALDVALKQLTLTEEQIKALLRLSRGESRPPMPGDAVRILDEVAALLAPVCSHQKIGFNVRRDDLDLQVGDADALRGALLNLGMNAIEAAGPGGVVSIATSHSPTGVVIEVLDNGPGVPEDLKEDVFAPFFTTKQEGAGLGLALARRAAEDCGGKLTLHRDNGLTTFRLTIPVDADRQAGAVGTPVPLPARESRVAGGSQARMKP